MREQKDDLTPEESELLGAKADSLEMLRKQHADCPPLELLLAARASVLPEKTGRGVAEHVAKCKFCQILVEDLTSADLLSPTTEENLRVRARVLPNQTSEVQSVPRRRERLFPAWLWPASSFALVAAAIAVAFLLLPLRKVTKNGTQSVAEVHKGPTATPQLEWEKLPIKLDATLVLVPRGQPRTTDQKYAAELTSALVSYRDDNFAKAAEQLADVARNFPNGKEGQLYLGISDLKVGKNAEAISPLQQAQKLGQGALRDDATWYLALAYQRLGRSQDSQAQLESLCSGHSSYKDQACNVVPSSSN